MKRSFFILFSILMVSPAQAESNSFSALMAAGQPVECTFQKADGSQSGTIYVAESQMRGEFIMNEGGQTYPMHMIRNAQSMYTWGGPMGENQGMVLSLANTGAPPMGSQSAVNMDEEMDFTCQPWAADAGQFEPPADVQFQDLAQLMQAAYAGAAQQQ